MISFSHQRSIGESLGEYGRGIAGGVMFSLPLLYTMEVWWAGLALHPWRMVIYVVFTFALLLLYNRFAGLRRDASLVEVAIDSVEEMGIGLVLAAAILWLTGRISGEMDGLEILGKVAMEGMTVAIGVSVGTAQLSTPDEGDGGVELANFGLLLGGALGGVGRAVAGDERLRDEGDVGIAVQPERLALREG